MSHLNKKEQNKSPSNCSNTQVTNISNQSSLTDMVFLHSYNFCLGETEKYI